MERIPGLMTILSLMVFLIGCAGAPSNPTLASQCTQGLNTAYHKLNAAKAKGFSGSINWGKAASLLSAAKVQEQFGKYPNCVNKVERAFYYIKQSQTN